jgi:hypothetical protein
MPGEVLLLNSPYSLHNALASPWSSYPDGIHQIVHDGPNLRRIAAIDGLLRAVLDKIIYHKTYACKRGEKACDYLSLELFPRIKK